MSLPDLVTARLRLIAITPEHLAVELAEPKRLGSVLGAKLPEGWPSVDWDANVIGIIQQQFAEFPETCGWHRYVVLAGEEPVLIGALGAFRKSDAEAEVGYGILEPWQKNGYASEGTHALIEMLFEHGVESVVAHTGLGMEASIRVMEKCGLAYEGPGDEEGSVRYRVRSGREDGA